MLNKKDFPRYLNKRNIDNTIKKYRLLLNDIPLNIKSNNVLELLYLLKRDKFNKGPYPSVSLSEGANRIMTDLVILYGIRMLLNGEIKDFHFKSYLVEYGNDCNEKHDVEAKYKGVKLYGEAFNVAKTFFQRKKRDSIIKLRKNNRDDIILLLYNEDAVNSGYTHKIEHNIFHLKVSIPKL